MRSINSKGKENYFREYLAEDVNDNIFFQTVENIDNRILIGGTKGHYLSGDIYLSELSLPGDEIGSFQKELTNSEDDLTSIVKVTNDELILAGTMNRSDVLDSWRSYILSVSDLVLTTNEIEFEHLTVHPNPFNDVVNVFSSQGVPDKIEFYSLTGTRVLTTRHNTINAKHLASGIYILKIYMDDVIISQKMIKQN